MSLDSIIVILLIAISAIYVSRHLMKELQASKSGKCGNCDLKKVCESKSNLNCELDSIQAIKTYDPYHK